jgi:hypothetical protein
MIEEATITGNENVVRFSLYFNKVVFFETMCKYLFGRYHGAVSGSEVGVCGVQAEYLK